MVSSPSNSSSFRHDKKKSSVTRLEIHSTLLMFNRVLAKLITFQLPLKCYMQESDKYKECVVEPPGRFFLSAGDRA